MPATLSRAEPLAWPAAHWTLPGHAMHDFQPHLRPLPLPLLDDTLKRYLASVQPLLTKAEYAQTAALVRQFASAEGGGPALQRLLELRARDCAAAGGHWLEAWWEHFAYLSCRAPLPVKWNIFATMLDASPCDAARRHRRAALLLHASAEFHTHLRAGRIAPDVLDTRGKIPLCMWQFDRLFASSRVPTSEACDEIITTPSSRHAVVFCDGHAYTVQVLSGRDGDVPVAAAEIERALIAIDEDAERRGRNPHPVSALTAMPRDEWARQHAAIKARDAASLSAIEEGLVALTLDRATPSDKRALCHAVHEGSDGQNCWYDKSVSFFVFANGSCGVLLEHAHFDAPIAARSLLYVGRKVMQAEENDADASPSAIAASISSSSSSSSFSSSQPRDRSWRRVDFPSLPSPVAQAIRATPPRFAELIAPNRLVPLRFEGGGRLDVLKLGRGAASADSVVQMAFQLAQLRDQGELVATYEAATTRRYAHGRTETIRSCSPSSAAFARAMCDPAASTQTRLAAFTTALREHGKLLAACSSGQGVDRHLMGLRIMAAMSGQPTPPIFTDKGYTKSTEFALSTSNNSNPGMGAEYNDTGGFGPPLVDCYGIAYQIQEEAVQMLISSDGRCKGRDADRFAKAVEAALTDVFGLIESSATELGSLLRNSGRAAAADAAQVRASL